MSMILAVALGVLTFALYVQTGTFEFQHYYDDDKYVHANPVVLSGLTLESIRWAFTTLHAANWHPLTWLSHMLDVEMFGPRPGPSHLVNAGLHAANAALLLLVLSTMTSAVWRSAFVAALFAWHPMHVESVAWISERKDVLSTLFGLGAIWFYVGFARRGGWHRYGLVLVGFGLSLLAKPMLVTLPFLLLVLDVWPLGRIQWQGPRAINVESAAASVHRATLLRLILEKAPLLVLSTVSCIVTLHAQQSGGAVTGTEVLATHDRFAHAAIAYCTYLLKLAWPADLCAYYPHMIKAPIASVIASVLALIAITTVAVAMRRNHPAMLAGWLWYLGTLVPVIGLVQVGSQAIADRYSYFPSIGLFMMAAWIAPGASRAVWLRVAVIVIAAAALTACALLTVQQTAHWRSGLSLWTHALSITGDNPTANNNLGIALILAGRYEEAIDHCTRVVRMSPEFVTAHHNLGVANASLGHIDVAIGHYREALRLDAGRANSHSDLGRLLLARGEVAEALKHLRESDRLAPGNRTTMVAMARALMVEGRISDAERLLQTITERFPEDPGAYHNLGVIRSLQGRADEARAMFARASDRRANDDTQQRAEQQLAESGRADEAIRLISRRRSTGFALPADRGR